MSLHTFQTCLVQLIVDPDYRDRVRALGNDALGASLTERERARLCRIAANLGLDINRTLHKGFRLGKLRAMLPLTCQLLGAARRALTRKQWALHAGDAARTTRFPPIPEVKEKS